MGALGALFMIIWLAVVIRSPRRAHTFLVMVIASVGSMLICAVVGALLTDNREGVVGSAMLISIAVSIAAGIVDSRFTPPS
jgi:ABC-type uncharacterized transport system permease subunit